MCVALYRRARLATFPDFLVIQMKKFTLSENWVPKKLGRHSPSLSPFRSKMILYCTMCGTAMIVDASPARDHGACVHEQDTLPHVAHNGDRGLCLAFRLIIPSPIHTVK